ncbi:phosphoribosyltransferase [Francisella sp. LA112445]|uniref:phosphoribosyltransferase n=1 Tax=Francisella sp. LA112445 TaxID=1395624 RepID=UPI001788A2E2|nr:phosphoribosyltransferase [Francisella sp. LA112445]QIW10148.1 phosphoribosyltransferase [Francisella sp. LA112445]
MIKKYLKKQTKSTTTLLKPQRVVWTEHFYPKIITHQKSIIRKTHADYQLAKAGNNEAAMKIAIDMLSANAIMTLNKIIGNKNIILLPISSLEEVGVNKIPRALANLLSDYLDCDVDTSIYQINSPQRTGKNPSYRMKNQPLFIGEVIKNQDYILVDDHSSMGATFANLIGYIETNGGRVIATTAISARVENIAINNKAINKSKQNIATKHFEKVLSSIIRQEVGYEFDYKRLTKAELGYLTQRIIKQRKSDKVKKNTSAIR